MCGGLASLYIPCSNGPVHRASSLGEDHTGPLKTRASNVEQDRQGGGAATWPHGSSRCHFFKARVLYLNPSVGRGWGKAEKCPFQVNFLPNHSLLCSNYCWPTGKSGPVPTSMKCVSSQSRSVAKPSLTTPTPGAAQDWELGLSGERRPWHHARVCPSMPVLAHIAPSMPRWPTSRQEGGAALERSAAIPRRLLEQLV